MQLSLAISILPWRFCFFVFCKSLNHFSLFLWCTPTLYNSIATAFTFYPFFIGLKKIKVSFFVIIFVLLILYFKLQLWHFLFFGISFLNIELNELSILCLLFFNFFLFLFLHFVSPFEFDVSIYFLPVYSYIFPCFESTRCRNSIALSAILKTASILFVSFFLYLHICSILSFICVRATF